MDKCEKAIQKALGITKVACVQIRVTSTMRLSFDVELYLECLFGQTTIEDMHSRIPKISRNALAKAVSFYLTEYDEDAAHNLLHDVQTAHNQDDIISITVNSNDLKTLTDVDLVDIPSTSPEVVRLSLKELNNE